MFDSDLSKGLDSLLAKCDGYDLLTDECKTYLKVLLLTTLAQSWFRCLYASQEKLKCKK